MKRARRVQVVLAAMLGAMGCVSVVACLDDLPEPKVCPPPPVNEAGDYTPLFSVSEPGCLSDRPEALPLESILAGPRESCACGEGECPSNGSACYPEGDCPPEVMAAAGAGAKCIRLEAEDFGFGQSDASQCMCGCARCMSVCDGRGPVMASVVTETTPYTAFPSISLANHLPASGKIGVYVRARGISNTVIGLFSGDYATANLVQRSVFVMTTPLDDFSEQVFYGADFAGNKEPYAWTDEAGRPDVLLLLNQVQSGQQLAYYEVDCVVPFVVP